MDEKESLKTSGEAGEDDSRKGFCNLICAPINWFILLAMEMHWSFVVGVVVVNGLSQGLGSAFSRVSTEYYMKDVQKVQPSEAQVYSGITSIPWMIKPIWGLLTDVVPVLGYRRRPYLILSGLLSLVSMLMLSLHEKLHLVLALLSLTAGSVGVAVADVTVDACVAENSNSHPDFATDMQSLIAFSESLGSLIGFSMSGFLVHLIGPKGVYGLLTIPAGLVFFVGILLDERPTLDFNYSQVTQNLISAGREMWTALKCPHIWRPCLYMYLSMSLCLDISEGMFYWYTDSKGGPEFSQEIVGFIFSFGSIGAFLGAILYQQTFKDHLFQDLLFWTQLLYGLSGVLDLMLVLRWNLKLRVPDMFFIVIDESVHQFIRKLNWMPLLVLSSKLCPKGIEGTFFALIMSIDNIGSFSASWGGGVLLHVLQVTRTKFDNLWLAILIRNFLRLAPLCMLFLVPRGDPSSFVLADEVSCPVEDAETLKVEKNVELVSLINAGDVL